MATPEEIDELRRYIAEPSEDHYTDTYCGEKIDALGVLGAAVVIWDQKAAETAELVNVSEAGASHSMSDLHKNALTMAKYFRDQVAATTPPLSASSTHPKVKLIVRQ
jgi:hypothetical protein